MTARPFPNWLEIYKDLPVDKMPWYFPELDPDLTRALAVSGIQSGRVLDLGTGPGTQAYALARLVFEVTASDLSVHAVELGREGSAARGLHIQFVQDDILNTQLSGPFDVVFDRGCFHVFAPELRARYAKAVRELLAPTGTFFLKCFSELQPGDVGPYQSSPEDIREVFAAHFELLSWERTIYQGTLAQPPQALFCTLRPNRA